MSQKILFVDDEPSALDGYKRLLHGKFEVSTATGGAEGLETIEKEGPFAIVISDMRMPGMSGADFLAEVRRQTPDTVRMLLTGHSDMHDVIEAVNRGNIFHFLTKPCAHDLMLAAINSGLDQYRTVMEERSRAQKAPAAKEPPAIPEGSDLDGGRDFKSAAGLPGPTDALEFLAPFLGKDSKRYIVLFRLPVLHTVESRYGEGAAWEYLCIAADSLQHSLRGEDALFHWRRDVLMAVLHRYIAPAAVRTELERLITATRHSVIENAGRRIMIACLITFDLLSASEFSDYEALLQACDTALAHNPEPAGAL